MRALRWLLLLLAVGASGVLAIVLALCFISLVNSFCPADELISGDVCSARWAPAAYSAGVSVATAIGAVLGVLSAYCISPSAKRLATWIIVAVGAASAVYVCRGVPSWEFLPGIAVAAILAFILTKHASPYAQPQNA
jgi:hypothetical protein